MQISSITDGQMFASGKTLPLLITAPDTTKNRDLEIEITLTSPTGEIIGPNRSSATPNEQNPITLPPNLAPGLYKLDIVLYSSGEVVQKKSASFFVAKDGWLITGIKSFPPLITTAGSVMLKAEIETPPDGNPYLRWSWKGKVIASGTVDKGFGQILWVAPSEEGVYTITLELFPSSPPPGTDFPFASALSLSTEIFVSSAKTPGKGDLGPETSYLSLLHLQASLADVGTESKKPGRAAAVTIGTPEIVSLDDGFGYRLDGSSGIELSWLALPVDAGMLRPFTVSLGVSFDDPSKAGAILTAAASDSSFSIVISMDPQTLGPSARIAARGATDLVVPWGGSALTPKQRYELSLSIVPQGGSIAAQWFLDGMQVSSMSSQMDLPTMKQDGTVVIGGDKGFAGVVDEFGVYFRDPAGRSAPDSDLFARAQGIEHGSRLVLAEGFDGIFLPASFTLEGSGELAGGTLALPDGSLLDFPPLKPVDSSVSAVVDLAADSARAATLQVEWEGSQQPPLTIPLAAEESKLRFSIGADWLSLAVPAGTDEKTFALPKPPQEGANLLLKVGNAQGDGTQLILSQVLMLKDSQ